MLPRQIACAAIGAALFAGAACAVPAPASASPKDSTATTATGSGSRPESSTWATTTPVPLWRAARPVAPRPWKSSFVTRQGTQLVLNGKPYRVVSVNAYEIGTYWGMNLGCGTMLNDGDLDAFFASLPTNTMLRVWGWQGAMGTNVFSHAREWRPLDRLVNAAARHGDRLIISLGDQSGICDDGKWKDAAWYRGGYRSVYPGDGYSVAIASYWDWIHEVVTRYKNSTAVAMWEPISEPEASDCGVGYAIRDCYAHLTCTDRIGATAALRAFFDTVGMEIKRMDPNHLVESGEIGSEQCGWNNGGSATIFASPGIDVGSFHDYGSALIPPELTQRLNQAQALRKPLLVGELGVEAGSSVAGCGSLADRRTFAAQKIDAMLAAGAAGVLLWNWVPDPQSSACTYDIGAGDPILTLLRTTIL